jgi:predicted Zn-dependent protease
VFRAQDVARLPGRDIGQLKARARVASAEGRGDEAIALLSEAVGLEDKLAYNKPNDIIFPTHHLLGAELLGAGKPVDAEAVFREDLKRHPHNGWAYYGLAQAVTVQKRDADAAAARKEFEQAWTKSDVKLAAVAF